MVLFEYVFKIIILSWNEIIMYVFILVCVYCMNERFFDILNNFF